MCKLFENLFKSKTKDFSSPIILYPISNSSNPENHHANWDIDKLGWLKWVDKYIKPMIDKGWTRFQIHNPFGQITGHQMESDQAISAIEAGLAFYLDDFEKAWAPITKQYEVICYMGSPLLTGRFFTNYTDQTKPEQLIYKDASTCMGILRQSYALPFHAGMSIGFDAMVVAPNENDLGWQFMMMLQDLKVRTYIETMPLKEKKWQWGQNFQITQQMWENILEAPDVWNAPFEQCLGEKILILNAAPKVFNDPQYLKYDEWLPKWIKESIANGFTPMFYTDKSKKELGL